MVKNGWESTTLLLLWLHLFLAALPIRQVSFMSKLTRERGEAHGVLSLYSFSPFLLFRARTIVVSQYRFVGIHLEFYTVQMLSAPTSKWILVCIKVFINNRFLWHGFTWTERAPSCFNGDYLPVNKYSNECVLFYGGERNLVLVCELS